MGSSGELSIPTSQPFGWQVPACTSTPMYKNDVITDTYMSVCVGNSQYAYYVLILEQTTV